MHQEQITVAGSDRPISATCYRMGTALGPRFDLFVDASATDSISTRIAQHTFTFPMPFRLVSELTWHSRRILDLGAYIGTFSLFAAARGFHVTAVEASTRNAALLVRSVERNRFSRVRVIQAAISDQQGSVAFVQGGPYGLVDNPYVEGTTSTVPATTVDALLREVGWDSIDLIKMDIEGSEVKAIRGMSQLLTRDDAPDILYESNGHTLAMFDQTPQTLMASLEAFGYACYLIQPGRLIPTKSDELQPECNVDYLATKHRLNRLKQWHVGSPISLEDRVRRIQATCAHPHPHNRAYIARVLSNADSEILSAPRVTNALHVLKSDPEPDVRAAASWWEGEELSPEAIIGLRKALLDNEVEVARLRAQVAGYERGRFMRAMQVLRQVRSRIGQRIG